MTSIYNPSSTYSSLAQMLNNLGRTRTLIDKYSFQVSSGKQALDLAQLSPRRQILDLRTQITGRLGYTDQINYSLGFVSAYESTLKTLDTLVQETLTSVRNALQSSTQIGNAATSISAAGVTDTAAREVVLRERIVDDGDVYAITIEGYGTSATDANASARVVPGTGSVTTDDIRVASAAKDFDRDRVSTLRVEMTGPPNQRVVTVTDGYGGSFTSGPIDVSGPGPHRVDAVITGGVNDGARISFDLAADPTNVATGQVLFEVTGKESPIEVVAPARPRAATPPEIQDTAKVGTPPFSDTDALRVVGVGTELQAWPKDRISNVQVEITGPPGARIVTVTDLTNGSTFSNGPTEIRKGEGTLYPEQVSIASNKIPLPDGVSATWRVELEGPVDARYVRVTDGTGSKSLTGPLDFTGPDPQLVEIQMLGGEHHGTTFELLFRPGAGAGVVEFDVTGRVGLDVTDGKTATIPVTMQGGNNDGATLTLELDAFSSAGVVNYQISGAYTGPADQHTIGFAMAKTLGEHDPDLRTHYDSDNNTLIIESGAGARIVTLGAVPREDEWSRILGGVSSGALVSAGAVMNESYDGRYLFAGSRYSGQPHARAGEINLTQRVHTGSVAGRDVQVAVTPQPQGFRANAVSELTIQFSGPPYDRRITVTDGQGGSFTAKVDVEMAGTQVPVRIAGGPNNGATLTLDLARDAANTARGNLSFQVRGPLSDGPVKELGGLPNLGNPSFNTVDPGRVEVPRYARFGEIPFYDSAYPWGDVGVPVTSDQPGAWAPSKVKINEFRTVDYGIVSTDEAFTDMIIGFQAARTASQESSYSAEDRLELLRIAEDHLMRAKEKLQGLQTRNGVVELELVRMQERHQQDVTRVKNRLGDLENVDPNEAAANYLAATTQLEASYAVTSRLLNLSLINML